MVSIIVVGISLVALGSVYAMKRFASALELWSIYFVYLVGLQPIYVVITMNLKWITMVNAPEVAIVTKTIGLVLNPIVYLWMVIVLVFTTLRLTMKLLVFLLAHAIFSSIDFLLVHIGYLEFVNWGLWQSVLRHLVLSFTGILFARWFHNRLHKERSAPL